MHTVVVGAGIVGLSSAYHLARRGATVTVLEKEEVGAGSTDRANGGIRAQFTSPVSVALSRESIAVWERFDERFGVDIGYRRPGYLLLAREPETAARFRENVRLQNEHGVPSEFLTPAAAAEHCPGLATERYAGATYSPTDGFADPHLALQGFSRAATEAGATVHTGVEVTDVVFEAGRVAGVETTTGRIEADHVVNAAGAWAGRVAATAGVELPISPRRRQLLVVAPDDPVPEDVPLCADLDGSVHVRPERDGRAVAGGRFAATDPEADPDRFRRRHDVEWAMQVLEALNGVADYFGPDSELRDGWAGLYAVTPDGHPVIDEVRPGFVVAAGFSGHGFMQSPATGRCVAELVLDGAAETVDVSALSLDRFERGAGLEEGTVID